MKNCMSKPSNKQIITHFIPSLCALVFFWSVALFAVYMMNSFMGNYPDWYEEPDYISNARLFMSFFFLAIPGFATIMIIVNFRRVLRKVKATDTSIKYSSSIETYSAEDVSEFEASGYATPTYIRVVPNFCSNCAGKLTDNTVEWVGPMTFICPHCGKQQDAERKAI